MPTQRKIDLVEELKKLIEGATITVSADYRGLRVQEMDQMRRHLRPANVTVRVIKNSLTVTLVSTMGPGINLDVQPTLSLSAEAGV